MNDLSQLSLRARETLRPFALSLSISPIVFPNARRARSDNCDNRPPSSPMQRPRACRAPWSVQAVSDQSAAAMRPARGSRVLAGSRKRHGGAPRGCRETFALRQFQVPRSRAGWPPDARRLPVLRRPALVT